MEEGRDKGRKGCYFVATPNLLANIEICQEFCEKNIKENLPL